tara:strand:- start:247 stop:1290 length:1044 start_codon:yes stop_codon:yes gene_type:complete
MFKKNLNISKKLSYSNEFDFARLMLAIAVVLQHCSTLLKTNNILNFNAIPAVPIFIFISGLFVTESFIFCSSIKRYFFKRIKRILPAYFTVVILGGLLVLFTKVSLSNLNLTNLISLIKYYLFNLLFLNFKYPCLQNTDLINNATDCAVNGSLWTIKFELLFYLLLPILIFFGRNSKKFFHVLTIISLVFVAFEKNMSIYLTIFFCFLSGVGFSVIRQNWNSLFKNIKINSYLRFLLVISVILLSGGILPLYLVLPLLLLTSFFPTKDVSKDLKISKFGDLSYGIYLIHFPIIRILSANSFLKNLPEPYLIFLVLFLSIIGAFFLYWKVERKFLEKNSYYYKMINKF